VAVIGGMISSTLLTLVVVPAVYSLVENGLKKLSGFNFLMFKSMIKKVN